MNAGKKIKKSNTKKIGRGSHWDKIADQALKRKQKIQNTNIFVSECGLGASGFPHIGSFADASRAYAVKMAVEDSGQYKSKFYAYSDDMDGLRKVPAGLPTDLEEWLGVPVSLIPDPEGCHNSYGEHMTFLLLDSLKKAGIDYIHKSAAKLYQEGAFIHQITKILSNTENVGNIIKETTGQEKYTGVIPFHPICNECKKIYTTTVHDFDIKKHQVSYKCKEVKIRGKTISGCDHQGISDYTKGEGKLSWKVEFASRWDALQVDFEPFGKDILESVTVNDRICREILQYEPPHHVRYEMFLDKGGSKISKSKGNVFTPQMWFNFGSPQSLILLTLKRIEGTRSLALEDIPTYMDEMDELEAIYFDLRKEKDQKQNMIKKALYEYCWWLKPSSEHSLVVKSTKSIFQPVSYKLLSHLARFAPPGGDMNNFARTQLLDYNMINSSEDWDKISSKFRYASHWAQKQGDFQNVKLQLSDLEIKTLQTLIKALKQTSNEPENIQSTIFNITKETGMKPRKLFSLLYNIYLGIPNGPRLGKLIYLMGIQTAIKKIQAVIS